MQTPEKVSAPLTPDQIRRLIDPIPRIRLTPLPAPMQECARLSAALGGPRIFIRRDGFILGADIHFLETEDPADMDRGLRELAEQYRSRGRLPHIMNHSGGFALGSALAYISSSGKGQAGLELAGRLLDAHFQVVGISARTNPDRLHDICRIADDTAERLGTNICRSRQRRLNRR